MTLVRDRSTGRGSTEPRPRTTRRPRPSGLGVVLVAPALLWVGGTLLFTLVLLASISLRDVQLGRLDRILRAPVTLSNYAEALTEAATWRSFEVSLLYVLGSTAIPFAIGLLTALLLNLEFPMRRLLRTLVLVPWAVPGVTATVAFMWMMTPTYGVMNYLLRSVGLIDGDVNWFGNESTALLSVIAPTSWKAYPFFTLMLLAGLQSISPALYEAAALDGAGPLRRLRWVTLPGLSPYILLSLIFNAMYSFREFDFIYASTRGGPDGATETIAVRIFNQAFEAFDFGAAATLGVITFALIAVLVGLLVARRFRGPLEGFL